jgi:hypothetical protein
MRFGFFDLLDWDYHAQTPLDGSQSAACHLAAALVAQGHDVSMLTWTSKPAVGDAAGGSHRSRSVRRHPLRQRLASKRRDRSPAARRAVSPLRIARWRARMGSVSQSDLAAAMKGVSVLAYPNTFAETSCISVMEAMAAGAHVVTSDLGALPETTAGFARFIGGDPMSPRYAEQFVDATVAAIDESDESKLRAQIDYINQQCVWSRRAVEWARWLHELCDSHHRRHITR